MKPFEVYCKYVALTQHFKVDRFDYFRYNGKIKATEQSFDKLNHRFAFFKLAKHPDPEAVILANIVDGPSDYIGNIITAKGLETYQAWLKRRESLSYNFKTELQRIPGSFVGSLKVKDGQHPSALKLYSRKSLSIESLIIIDDLTGCFDRWNASINDPVVWPSVAKKCLKYKPFFEYNREGMLKILRDDIENRV